MVSLTPICAISRNFFRSRNNLDKKTRLSIALPWWRSLWQLEHNATILDGWSSDLLNKFCLLIGIKWCASTYFRFPARTKNVGCSRSISQRNSARLSATAAYKTFRRNFWPVVFVIDGMGSGPLIASTPESDDIAFFNTAWWNSSSVTGARNCSEGPAAEMSWS